MPLRIKHLLHSSAVRYGEIFHSPYLTLTHVISFIYLLPKGVWFGAVNVCVSGVGDALPK